MRPGRSPRCSSSPRPQCGSLSASLPGFPRGGKPSSRSWWPRSRSPWSSSSSTPKRATSGRPSASSMRSCWPCPAPTTPCSGSSTPPMTNCAPWGISTGRSARPHGMAIPGRVQPNIHWPSAGGYFARRTEQAGAQVAERAGEQTRHMHLGNTELLADLGLVHVPVEPQQQDSLLAGGQVSPVRQDRLHLYRVLNLRVLLAHQISEVVLLTAS